MRKMACLVLIAFSSGPSQVVGAAPVYQADANTSWAELKQAAGGRSVTVRPKAGGDVEGTIVSVDESQLIIAATPRQTALSKSQVCRVTTGTNRHLGRAMLIGAGALGGWFVGGLIRGFVTDDPNDHSPEIGAAAGGALGAVIPFGTTRILYESPAC